MVVSLRMSELLVHSSRWGVGLNEDIYASFPVPVPIHHDEQLMCSCGGTRKFLVGFLEELLPFGSFLSCFKTTCIHLSATFWLVPSQSCSYGPMPMLLSTTFFSV
ncbi:hypothetical protein ABKV19_020088 [Rosa sericea]